jgi:hypothetical protein
MTIGNKTNFDQLIQGLQQTQPRLYDALKLLSADIQKLNLEVFPPLPLIPPTPPAPLPVPIIASFNYSLHPESVFVFWSLESGTAVAYELRLGPVFDSAQIILRTDTTSASLPPMLVGTHKLWLQAIGVEAVSAPVSLDVVIPPLGILTISASVIDNNVLLYWSQPTSVFLIDYYKVMRGEELIGLTPGTFTVVFEQRAGTYEYSVTAYDVAGNTSPTATIAATVLQPPDYELQDEHVSDLTHEKVNVLREAGPPPYLLCCVRTETWEQHFMDRSWTSIQDQIDAGFPIYIQPLTESGSYKETYDIGTVLDGSVVSISWNSEIIYPNGHDIIPNIEYSVDGISWEGPFQTVTVFAASIRYLRVTMEFNALN